MRVLSIGGDRSKRGVFFRGSPAYVRQKAYAERFGEMHIVGFSRKSDDMEGIDDGALHVHPTNSSSRWLYARDALRIAKTLPKPDVVTAQDPFEAGLAALRVAKHFSVPLHIQIHTDFLSPNFGKTPLNLIRRLISGYVLRRATRIRVVSNRIRESIKDKYRIAAEISIIPIFVDVAALRNREPDPSLVRAFDRFDRKVLFVGRLEPEKNAELAIRAFGKLAPERTCLIIVGNGSEYPKLKKLADRINNPNQKIFFETETQSAKYYPIEDLVLVTSRYEGYGLVIVEALAAGKPVLSTDVGVAREAGAIVTDEAHFAGALAQWFKDGPREGHLRGYPYGSFDEYVAAYCDDIEACTRD